MTKLCCPKGHSGIQIVGQLPDGNFDTIHSCQICRRDYFYVDCLSEPLVNDTNVADITKTESQVAIDRVMEALEMIITEALGCRNLTLADLHTKDYGDINLIVGLVGSISEKLKELNK